MNKSKTHTKMSSEEDDEEAIMAEQEARRRAKVVREVLRANNASEIYDQVCGSRVVVIENSKRKKYYVLMGKVSYGQALELKRVPGKGNVRPYHLRFDDETVDICLAQNSEPWPATTLPSKEYIGLPIGCTCEDWRWRSTQLKKVGYHEYKETGTAGYAHDGCKHMLATAQAISDTRNIRAAKEALARP